MICMSFRCQGWEVQYWDETTAYVRWCSVALLTITMSQEEFRPCVALVNIVAAVPHQEDSNVAGEVRAPISSIQPLPMNERKVIAHRAMLMIDRPHAIVNLGIGMPEVIVCCSVACAACNHTVSCAVSSLHMAHLLSIPHAPLPLSYPLGPRRLHQVSSAPQLSPPPPPSLWAGSPSGPST